MQENHINTKRIAKNTLFLYARLILVIGVTLYTSRVVLDKLGVTDFGLYHVVFGVIGMLTFLNGTLSSGTSRFITYELGAGDKQELKSTFSTALLAHITLALVILLIGETVGLWYATQVMVVPEGRMGAAMVVYQISVVTTMMSIVRVPFTSEIIAHERMNVYAYMGMYEAIAQLLVVYVLIVIPSDRLIIYAILQLMVACSVLFIYIVYAKRKFKEVSFKWYYNKQTFSKILKFSGWNIIANLSNTLSIQGIIMLFNLFFQPFVVAAQAVSNQISSGLMLFVNNVRQAVTPQIIKLYANEQYKESQRLTFLSAEYILYLLLLLGVPCIMVMQRLLDVWLVEVPEYAVEFAQLAVVQCIVSNTDGAFYTSLLAANKLEKNSLAALVLCGGQFVLLAVLFYFGCGPLWARYMAIFVTSLFSFVVKPYILWKDIDYSLSDLSKCIWHCVKVMIVIAVVSVAEYMLIPQHTTLDSLIVVVVSVLTVCAVSCLFMSKSERAQAFEMIINKIPVLRR